MNPELLCRIGLFCKMSGLESFTKKSYIPYKSSVLVLNILNLVEDRIAINCRYTKVLTDLRPFLRCCKLSWYSPRNFQANLRIFLYKIDIDWIVIFGHIKSLWTKGQMAFAIIDRKPSQHEVFRRSCQNKTIGKTVRIFTTFVRIIVIFKAKEGNIFIETLAVSTVALFD